MHDGSRKAVFAALFANLGIAVAKFVGFLITSSAGLLAESVHSLADSGNQALLLLGGSRARRKATPEHPFGYGRERYFWAFVVALVLFSMGGLFALYEGIEKFRHPHEVESLWVAIGILVFAIVLETISLRTAVVESNRVKRKDQSWWRFIRTSKQPELPVVLLEDIGAECGLFFALFGVIMAKATGNPRWDAAGSIAIGVLLVVIAIVLAIEMKGLLIGEGAAPDVQNSIVTALTDDTAVHRLIHLRTEHIGPDELLVAAKVEFDPALSVSELASAINATEARVRHAVPIARIIYLEPDLMHVAPA
ncbi:MAG TPA: cation diffusion facilitator family transporter [Acidimicrobiales bacterium]|nr:cation diffusion facilitator family transporter [Acidimicrobiales bacterium]